MSNEYPPRGYPPPTGLVPQGIARQARHATVQPVSLGETRAFYDPIVDHPEYRQFQKVLAYFVVSMELGGEDGAQVTGNEQLRPEPFVLTRITWATTADLGDPSSDDFLETFFPFNQSQHGRAVEVTWGDSFTRFLGKQSALVSAIFADSEGYLDIPGTALFQGSQNLQVTLKRLQWPIPDPGEEEPAPRFTTRWDFVFAGFTLLPPGINQSGSVG